MVLIRLITIDDVRRAADLVRAHYDEIARKKHLRVLDPDWVAYQTHEDAGRLFSLGAFDGETLVGYSLNVDVPAHLHYRGLHYVQNDVLYVADAHRSTGTGARLMEATRREAKRRGAVEMLWHAKSGSALHRVLDGRAELVDLIYSQEL